MDKQSFMQSLIEARREWEAAVARVPFERMAEPGVQGEWSLKDIIAHVAWYEREMVDMLRRKTFAGSDLWNEKLDARNAAIYNEVSSQPLLEVLADEQHQYTDLVDELQKTPDEAFTNSSSFPGMPADWEPAAVIASNTFEHYQEHLPDLYAWLNKAG